MLFARAVLAAFVASPILGVFAGHSLPRGVIAKPYGTGHKGASRREVVSTAATLTNAKSKMDKLFSEYGKYRGTQPIADLSAADPFLSSVNDISSTVAAGTDTCQPGADALLVDSDGSKLTNDQMGDKVAALVKSFETACSLVKDFNNADLGDFMQTIALSIELMQDDLGRCMPDVARSAVVVDTIKSTQDSLSAMIDDAYGPEPADD